jgi:predicted ABC-type ATPase
VSRTPRKPERPVLWIIAGPNGSGKSSLYNRSDIEGWGGSVWIINPDLLTLHIVEKEGLALQDANLKAVQRIEHWLNTSLEVYQTIGVETVLSSPKYRDLVIRARARGFEVRMLYVLLQTPELQIARVRIRVRTGGHDVPEDKIRSRRTRSLAELAWFAEHVDRLAIFDNSAGAPELMATKTIGDGLNWHYPPSPALALELEAAGLAMPVLEAPTKPKRRRRRGSRGRGGAKKLPPTAV